MDKISNRWKRKTDRKKNSYAEKQKKLIPLKELKFQKIISQRLFGVRL